MTVYSLFLLDSYSVSNPNKQICLATLSFLVVITLSEIIVNKLVGFYSKTLILFVVGRVEMKSTQKH